MNWLCVSILSKFHCDTNASRRGMRSGCISFLLQNIRNGQSGSATEWNFLLYPFLKSMHSNNNYKVSQNDEIYYKLCEAIKLFVCRVIQSALMEI